MSLLSAVRFRGHCQSCNCGAAHRVEVGGERMAAPRFQLRDKLFHVGGDDLPRRRRLLRLLRLFGVFADGGDVIGGGYVAHGVFSCGFWLLHVRVETRHVHAERHLAKAGVASVKGSGYLPPAAERRARLYRVIFGTKIMGKPLDARDRAEPLSVLRTSVTKQTGDMVYSGARRRQFLSFGYARRCCMPWKESRIMDQRLQFLSSYQKRRCQ